MQRQHGLNFINFNITQCQQSTPCQQPHFNFQHMLTHINTFQCILTQFNRQDSISTCIQLQMKDMGPIWQTFQGMVFNYQPPRMSTTKRLKVHTQKAGSALRKTVARACFSL